MYSAQHLEYPGKSRKRLFIGLLAISLLLLLIIVLTVWWLITKRGILINKLILIVFAVFLAMGFLLLGMGLLALVWSLWRAKSIPSMHNIMHQATTVLFPFALQLGKWLGWDEEKVKNSYIQVSNQLVRSRTKAHPSKRILILAPHCLQWVNCPNKITVDTENCKECGKCPVADLKALSRRMNVNLVVATGGTFARKAVKEKRPEAIVAIACERDLTSGIQDVAQIPVLGVVNERPEGPCSNTRVDMQKVEEAISYLQKGG